MSLANWKTQTYNVIQSLLFKNPHRVIEYSVMDESGKWVNRADRKAPVKRLYATEAGKERTCLQTIQFVHHMLIPPGGRHVEELHIHPDAEELVVVTCGHGTAIIDKLLYEICPQDVLYIAPGAEHEIRNTGEELLGVLFINVPTGEGLQKLQAANNQMKNAPEA